MGARKNTLVYKVASAQSLSADFTSSPTNVRYLDNCAYQINVTTTDSGGSFKIQGSVDFAMNEPDNLITNPGTWVDLELAGGTPLVTGADTNILIDLNQLSFMAIRVAYTSTVAGTGTCDIYLVCKQLGG